MLKSERAFPLNEQAYLKVDSVPFLSELAPNRWGLHKNESYLPLIEQVCSKMSEFVQVYATFPKKVE